MTCCFQNGIRCDSEKVQSVLDWPIPKDIHEIRVFLGLAGYYRKFIPNFSELAAPLVRLTRRDVKFSWDNACHSSFKKLKTSLVNAPILSYPNMEDVFLLDTDACYAGMGAVLSQ